MAQGRILRPGCALTHASISGQQSPRCFGLNRTFGSAATGPPSCWRADKKEAARGGLSFGNGSGKGSRPDSHTAIRYGRRRLDQAGQKLDRRGERAGTPHRRARGAGRLSTTRIVRTAIQWLRLRPRSPPDARGPDHTRRAGPKPGSSRTGHAVSWQAGYLCVSRRGRP
jgi:hypothetical protein